jgi:hypothetical protein
MRKLVLVDPLKIVPIESKLTTEDDIVTLSAHLDRYHPITSLAVWMDTRYPTVAYPYRNLV